MFFPYIDNNYFLPFPFIPANCNKPPTIYALLESIVNYGKDDKTKIKDLAKVGRSTIFDFDYPLSEHISKEDFETMILNHYITRRIGFDTPTLFKIQLNVKLNEIMPMYNKMFDALSGWDIFNDGEKTSRYGTDNREISSTSETENVSETENSLHNETTSENTSDRRFSDTPQNELENVRDGSYVTDYNYDTNTANSNDTSTSNGKSESVNNNKYNETIEKSPANKIELMKEFQENIHSIYSMIFKDLECLFYQLV